MRRGWARSEASWDVPGPQREASVNSILYPKAPPSGRTLKMVLGQRSRGQDMGPSCGPCTDATRAAFAVGAAGLEGQGMPGAAAAPPQPARHLQLRAAAGAGAAGPAAASAAAPPRGGRGEGAAGPAGSQVPPGRGRPCPATPPPPAPRTDLRWARRQRGELEELRQQLEDSSSAGGRALRAEFEKGREEQERRHQVGHRPRPGGRPCWGRGHCVRSTTRASPRAAAWSPSPSLGSWDGARPGGQQPASLTLLLPPDGAAGPEGPAGGGEADVGGQPRQEGGGQGQARRPPPLPPAPQPHSVGSTSGAPHDSLWVRSWLLRAGSSV